MRTKLSRVFVAGAMALSGLVAVSGERIVQAALNNDLPFQAQSELDQETIGNCAQWCAGGWGAMEDGVNDRPYIERLGIYDPVGNVETRIIDNLAGDPDPAADASSNVRATVSAINLCAPGQSSNCYDTPNRVQVNFGWRDGDQGTADLGADGSIPAIDSDSEIRVVIALNTLGRSLRWSYLEGTPTYWQVNNIGKDDATIELHFKPVMKPWTSNGGGCSQIPVNTTCEYTSADAQYLMGSLLLSLDDTLDPVFTGALFAGEGLYIGSLEASSPAQTETGGSSPQMTYGIAAPRTIAGENNIPRFHAFLSDETILNYFGATPEVAATEGFFNTAFSVASTGTSSPTIVATRWTPGDNGSAGWLIEISDIALTTVTTPSGFSANRLHAAARVVRNPRFTVKNKYRAPTISASRTGVVVTGMPQGCTNNRNCRIVVSRINSKTGSRTIFLRDSLLVPSGGSLRASVSFPRLAGEGVKAPRLSIMIQRKVNNRWNTYVTSVVRSVR